MEGGGKGEDQEGRKEEGWGGGHVECAKFDIISSGFSVMLVVLIYHAICSTKKKIGGRRREDMKNITAELCAHTSIIISKCNESGCCFFLL